MYDRDDNYRDDNYRADSTYTGSRYSGSATGSTSTSNSASYSAGSSSNGSSLNGSSLNSGNTYTGSAYGGATNSDSPNNKKPNSNKGKKIFGIVGLVLAGALAGSLVCYSIMNTQFHASFKVNGEEKLPQFGKDNDASDNAQSDIEKFADSIFDFAGKDGADGDAADNTGSEDGIAEEDPYGIAEDDIADAAGDVALPSEFATTGGNSTMSVAQIVEKCLPSVVAITNMSETEVRSFWGENYTRQSQSAGSGIIVGETEDELLILTNFHVVENNVSLSVLFNGEEAKDADDANIINAVIKDYDSDRDIAVIAVKLSDITPEIKANISVATIGDSDELALGEQIVAIGNALGYGQSVTTGIVSALDRTLGGSSIESGDNTFIQTDAAINPGNSGGAMFNMRGELVGVNSAKMGGSTIEGMGYAIPISGIIGDVQDMMTQETKTVLPEDERGYLGVSIVDVTAEISKVYGLPQGIYISAVNPGSGAENAGIKKEDIIVGINGKKVTSSAELKEKLAYYAKGDIVTITVSRMADDGYTETDLEVVLGELGE